MGEAQKRLIGYQIVGAAVAALVYVGFIHEAEADTMTLLDSARVHAELASSLPATDAAGRPTQVRVDLLRNARDFADRAVAEAPELAVCHEMLGVVAFTAGQYEAAARHYATASTKEGLSEVDQDNMVLNEVRMWRSAGKPEAALRVLVRREASFVPSSVSASQVEKMLTLSAAGDEPGALQVAVELAEISEHPMALIEAGHFLESRKRAAMADAAFSRAVAGAPIANYYRARLKIRGQQIDSGLDLLEKAVAADGSRTRNMIAQDAESWAPCADNDRFKDLISSVSESASPGR